MFYKYSALVELHTGPYTSQYTSKDKGGVVNLPNN